MLTVTKVPNGPVLVKEQFAISGTAASNYAGKVMTLIIDNQFRTNGPIVAADGSWTVQFLFQQSGNRKLRIAVENESVEVPIQVVATLPPGARIRFLNPPKQAIAREVIQFQGEADNYVDGARLLLRADGAYELARPVVKDGAWQASTLFTQPGQRDIELIGDGQDRTAIDLTIVAAPPKPPRLTFTTIPSPIQAKQTVVFAGSATDYPDGAQLLLRTDKAQELARPIVAAQKWQAPVVFPAAGSYTIELVGSETDKASLEVNVTPAPTPIPRPPRVSFTNPPAQVTAEQVILLTGKAENYANGAQLVLRVDQRLVVARPVVSGEQWKANTLFHGSGARLVEIIGSEQDKAQITLNVRESTSDLQVSPRSVWTTTTTPTSLPNLSPLRITLHHTYISPTPPVNATQAQEVERMRAIWRSHVNGNGWSDIGYHFIIMPSGRIYEARSERKRGSHDVINDGLGIAFDGVYSSATISQPQFESAVALCTALCQRYKIADPVTPVSTPTADFGTRNLPRILGHRDRVSTECPGSEGGRTVRLAEIRQAVKNRL